MRGESMTELSCALLRSKLAQCIVLSPTRLIQAIWFAGEFFRLFFITPPRLPGLPIRDCTVSPNNRGLGWPKLSAIDVTAKTICAFLFWFWFVMPPHS